MSFWVEEEKLRRKEYNCAEMIVDLFDVLSTVQQRQLISFDIFVSSF